MITLKAARKLAEKVVGELRPHCVRIEIAGSIRRERPEIGDVDLVIEVANFGRRQAIEDRIRQSCLIQKSGEQNLVAVTKGAGGVQLDLWFSRSAKPQGEMFEEAEAAPDNFGSLLLCRTGSVQHNMAIAERAKRLGAHWNPHQGIYQDGRWAAGETEAQIYAFLRLPFLEPVAERELDKPGDVYRLVNREHVAP